MELRPRPTRSDRLPEQSRFASVLGLLASVLLLTAGTNLQGVLLPIRRQMEGASLQQIGLLSSGWSSGFVLACLVMGRLVSSVGHVRSFAGLAAVSGATSLLLLPLDDEAAWVVLRVVIGFCFGGLSMIIESWLNERSGTDRRGGIFAAYMTVTLLASLTGTLSLAVLDPERTLPFTLMGVLIVLSIVPVTLTRSPSPKPTKPYSIQLWALYRVSPTGVFGCFTLGIVGGTLGGLLPAYGLSVGMSTHQVASLLAAALIGGALAYYPAGALSDHLDRRIVIIALSCLSALCCAVLVRQADLAPHGIMLVVGAFGFCQYPIYGVCVAIANDRVRERAFSKVASELLIIYGTGTILGPPLAAVAMQSHPRFLFLFMGALLLALAGFSAVRIWIKPRTARDMKRRSHPLETAPPSMHVFRPSQGEDHGEAQ